MLYCGWFFGTWFSCASSCAFCPSTSFQAISMFFTSCIPPAAASKRQKRGRAQVVLPQERPNMLRNAGKTEKDDEKTTLFRRFLHGFLLLTAQRPSFLSITQDLVGFAKLVEDLGVAAFVRMVPHRELPELASSRSRACMISYTL